MTLINITGEIASGKTTIAQCLKHNLPGTTIIVDENTSIKGLKLFIKYDKNLKWIITDGFAYGNDIINELSKGLPNSKLNVVNIQSTSLSSTL